MSSTSRSTKVKALKAGGAAPAKRKAARGRKVPAQRRPSAEPRLETRESGYHEPLNCSLFQVGEVALNSVNRAEMEAQGLYDPEEIVDAPEYHELSKALGILTWDIWDQDVRSVSERKRDLATAFPPRDPTAFSLGGMERRTEHEWSPRARDRELERFLSRDGKASGIDGVLARYGLKLKGAPALQFRRTPIREFLQAARERNHGLRILHGSVDIEPEDMDSAKSAFIERQEKRRAAEEIRAARKRLKNELEDEDRGRDP